MPSLQPMILRYRVLVGAAVAFVAATVVGLQVVLFQLTDVDVYRVLETSGADLLLIAGVVALQALGLEWLLSRQTPLKRHPMRRTFVLLLLLSALNSTAAFWLNESRNEGRHVRYAQALAPAQDAHAEPAIVRLLADGAYQLSRGGTAEDWAQLHLRADYLAAHYDLTVGPIPDTPAAHVGPNVVADRTPDGQLMYRAQAHNGRPLHFTLRPEQRASVHLAEHPYRELQALDNYHFAVVEAGRIRRSNTSNFGLDFAAIPLPLVGEARRLDWQGHDVLVYRHSDQRYVLIGEPLSEFEVWISNFALFFSLLLALLLLGFGTRFVYEAIKDSSRWTALPIEAKIRGILVGTTLMLFCVIAVTSMLFVVGNNEQTVTERQLSTSKRLRLDLLTAANEHAAGLQVSPQQLRVMANRHAVDVALFAVDGTYTTASFVQDAGAEQHQALDKAVLRQLQAFPDGILVSRGSRDGRPTVRTALGLTVGGEFAGLATTETFTDRVDTAESAAYLMSKLLNVYVMLLLLTWLAGGVLIRLLVQPLKLLARRLRNFTLGAANEPLSWPGNDAIGGLIAEYNKMVGEVESKTAELMQAEREGAWGIMAQQIAHEINNTLSPLRMQTQYIGMVLSRQQVPGLVRITEMAGDLTERIDRLSAVAQRFQLFAGAERRADAHCHLATVLTDRQTSSTQPVVLQVDQALANRHLAVDAEHLNFVVETLFSYAVGPAASTEPPALEVRQTDRSLEFLMPARGLEASASPSQLFDPKFSEQTSDTGIELPICSRLLQLYGGSIELIFSSSGAPSFRVSLPLEVLQEEPVALEGIPSPEQVLAPF